MKIINKVLEIADYDTRVFVAVMVLATAVCTLVVVIGTSGLRHAVEHRELIEQDTFDYVACSHSCKYHKKAIIRFRKEGEAGAQP